jgi:hypothetical protein
MPNNNNSYDYDLPFYYNYVKNGSKTPAIAFRDENNGFTYYFSYSTLVAFQHTLSGLVVRANAWGNTTGKHLNAIDGGSKEAKEKRILYIEDFRKELQKAYSGQRKAVIAVNDIIKEAKDKEFRNSRLAERIKSNAGYSKAGH